MSQSPSKPQPTNPANAPAVNVAARRNARDTERRMTTAAMNTGTKAMPITIIHAAATKAGPMSQLVAVSAMNRDDATGEVVVPAILEARVAQHA